MSQLLETIGSGSVNLCKNAENRALYPTCMGTLWRCQNCMALHCKRNDRSDPLPKLADVYLLDVLRMSVLSITLYRRKALFF